MEQIHHIGSDWLDMERIAQLLGDQQLLLLSPGCESRVEACRSFLDGRLDGSDQLYYGINTGFGSLCNIAISKEETLLLQKKLVLSHACGIGDEVPADVVKIMLLLKIQSLSYGHSGIRLETLHRLVDFYNYGVMPIVYQLGSLGASGDLAPLAHLALPLIGEGEVRIGGQKLGAQQALQRFSWRPLQLHAKEGLAMLNGTQFSAAYSVWCLLNGKRLARLADQVAALSLDAFACKLEPFDPRLHAIRPHRGQRDVAANILRILAGSELSVKEKVQVQDPYAFRCVPQVHGASWQAIHHFEEVLTVEVNSVTDNPNIFPEEGAILSGGNFHAQPLALALDYLAIALSELGSIAERRVFQLISGQRGLPPYLAPNAGLDSGYMIAQYTAASIASQNKQLCTPASVDSIVSCNGQEDHVSMAANAATKCYRVVENLERLLAIEFMVAAQALEFRRPLKTSPELENWVAAFRKRLPIMQEDRWLHAELEKTLAFLREWPAH
jgi:histidine ammonia-lyase